MQSFEYFEKRKIYPISLLVTNENGCYEMRLESIGGLEPISAENCWESWGPLSGTQCGGLFQLRFGKARLTGEIVCALECA